MIAVHTGRAGRGAVARVDALERPRASVIARARDAADLSDGDEHRHRAGHVLAGVIDRGNATTPPTQQAFDHLMHTNVLGLMQVLPQVMPMVEAAGGVFGALSSRMAQIGPVSGSGAWLGRPQT